MKKIIDELLTRESRKTNGCLCGGNTDQITSSTSVALVILASGKKVSDFKDHQGKNMLFKETDMYLWTRCYKVPEVMERLSVFLGL